mmetsp:Transcript_29466/g.67763  ORF Transcript_29466/g.67763 Transcript_29466/m.67763 type:complete len:482 (-) Transcript_29466:57-1502(-)|eukprot:CAMPEP_0113312706 /NCGR_PEP_ID=MMETSP0010_2-20120614/9434_1 /TAXON_ID=216773 ORGANISM="Corethron hystrix, Strain 308" /NCGR_SAMPLE_ID=MMETSP0010_2 /ASSEMBLY_ACC=CAM_ASM_000155 /LENGTH=481 /DNA_ID=CAMNT_0000168595 /DNA_START=67 /DNA_END=1512 /DNA_ORIENTATION=+ /assembly_acc=CAM_ASM_000155
MIFRHIFLVTYLAANFKVLTTAKIITNKGISSKDISPSIGRGYSVTTGNIASACLDVDVNTDITEPSFDYDYKWFEVNSQENVATQTQKHSFSSKSFGWFTYAISSETTYSTSRRQTEKQHILADMIMDKYYISADETKTSLLSDALTLIDQGLYIQFFQACGPNYIRSIRRESEMVSMFSYEKKSGSDSSVSIKISRSFFGSSSEVSGSSSSFKDTNIKITFAAFGISLKDASPFVAKDVESYKTLVDNAFRSMLLPDIGNVVSIEIVPWMANVVFQNAAVIDTTIQTEDPDTPTLAPFLRRFNLLVNSEHVARLDEITRNRLTMFNLQLSCLGRLSAMPLDSGSLFLVDKQERCPNLGDCAAPIMTVSELKGTLLGYDANATAGQKYLVQRSTQDMQGYVENYFGPCLQAMAEQAYGIAGGAMQAQHWSAMPACSEISCVFPNVVWDQASRTCIVAAATANRDATIDKYCMPEILDPQP